MSPPSDPRQQALAAGARFAQGGSLNCDAAAAQWFQTGEASALECAAALGAVAADAAFVVGFRDERAAMLKIVNKTVTLRRSSGAVVGSRTLPTSYRDRPAHFAGPVALWCEKWAAVHEHEGRPAIFLLGHEVDALAAGRL